MVHINLDTLKTRRREAVLFDECIKSGKDIVIDNTNPTPEDRVRFIEPAKDAGYEIIGYYFSSSITECLARNSNRTGKKRVPDIAVASVHAKLVIPSMDEGFDKLYYVKLTESGFITEEWRV